MSTAPVLDGSDAPKPPMRRFLVALDVDGTIVSLDGSLSPRVRSAIRAVRDAGHHVVIATGRSIPGATEIAARLGIDTGWLVLSNGTLTVRLDPALPGGLQVVEAVTFDPTSAVRMLRDLLPGALFAVERPGRGYLVSTDWPVGELGGAVTVVDDGELLAEPCLRVVVRDFDRGLEEFERIVRGAGLHGVTWNLGWTSWLDLTPDGVSKATGLEALRPRLGVDQADTVAVGDFDNDVEMLRWAARGVAMGQAEPHVVAAADEVCAPVTEDGLADVLESLLAPAGTAPAGTAPAASAG